MADGKPFLLKTPYGNLGGAEAWKPITENFVGFRVSHEYMRRMPLLFLTRTVREFEQQYAQKIVLLNRLATRDFSEFNAIGALRQRTIRISTGLSTRRQSQRRFRNRSRSSSGHGAASPVRSKPRWSLFCNEDHRFWGCRH